MYIHLQSVVLIILTTNNIIMVLEIRSHYVYLSRNMKHSLNTWN